MKYFLVLCAVFFCWTYVSAGGIQCYNCVGTDDECAKDKLLADKPKYLVLVTCSLSDQLSDRCITIRGKKHDAVMKACSTKSECDEFIKECGDKTDGQCVVDCCDTDECNAGSPELPTGSTKCYACTGTDDECAKDKLVADKAKYLVTCPLSKDRCITVSWVKNDDKISVWKSCLTKSECDTYKKNCDMADVPCAVNCCDTDECNAVTPGLPNSK
ncbi:uncharacterized protein LOC144638904 isoform X1 [Oculina patagonica]